MSYSEQNIERITEGLEEWLARLDDVIFDLAAYQYRTEKGREFAIHGVSRRLDLIRHNVTRIFEIVPLDVDAPSPETLMDATAFLQSCMANIYGALDNIAWVWNCETEAGFAKPLGRSDVGLRPKQNRMKKRLGAKLSAAVGNGGEWFAYIESYRDALAHRIPLYIPPRQLNEAEAESFRVLSELAAQSATSGDWAGYDAARSKQARLGKFVPRMMHSYGEGALPVPFHPQLVCDLATVVNAAEALSGDLADLLTS